MDVIITPDLYPMTNKTQERLEILSVLEQLKDVFRYMESEELTYVKTEILKICKNQEIKRAIMESVALLKMGNYDEIKSNIDSAMKAGADTDVGL